MAGCCPAGVKHFLLATLLGKVMIGDMRATVTERLNRTYHPCWNLYEDDLPSRQYPLIVTGPSCHKARRAINQMCGMQAGKSTIILYKFAWHVHTRIRHVF